MGKRKQTTICFTGETSGRAQTQRIRYAFLEVDSANRHATCFVLYLPESAQLDWRFNGVRSFGTSAAESDRWVPTNSGLTVMENPRTIANNSTVELAVKIAQESRNLFAFAFALLTRETGKIDSKSDCHEVEGGSR
jgi:hypothetical protein